MESGFCKSNLLRIYLLGCPGWVVAMTLKSWGENRENRENLESAGVRVTSTLS